MFECLGEVQEQRPRSRNEFEISRYKKKRKTHMVEFKEHAERLTESSW